MTCIVGLEHQGSVYIGADSAEVLGWEVKPTSIAKVFRVRNLVIGYTSSFRMGQILHHFLSVPDRNGECEEKYLVCQFIPAVREVLKEGGYTKVENNQESVGTFLVGFNGHLYYVSDDLSITRTLYGVDACGCGRAYVLGAMEALQQLEPRQRIEQALAIAEKYSGSVCGPFTILKGD